jgi:hypothetical protein
MNCCNEYGKCEQGQGCPARVTPFKPCDVARNAVLEEVATQFDMMPALGDTAASFAVFVRDMKR